MGSNVSTLFANVEHWIAADPDPETQAEAHETLTRAQAGDAAALAALTDAFGGRLEFGTAGLRAEIGAGPRRMNRVVVQQTTAGFAAFLNERAARGETSSTPSVIIGYDGRKNSDVFARDAAAVMAGAGIRALLLPEPLPTPVTAFAVRHLKLSAGIMITASHNPPNDNGYKVYLGDADQGSQIAPPTDSIIAAHIDSVAKQPLSDIPQSGAYTVLGPETEAAYVAHTASALKNSRLAETPNPPEASGAATQLAPVTAPLFTRPQATVVYTAMHGVGSDTLHSLLHVLGISFPIVVAEQDRPDGTFPTVSFPNPEEPGALDLAMRTAREHRADLIIANDPDADRLALAAPDADAPGGYRMLTGNELGLLLGWRAAEHTARLAQAHGTPVTGALANTIVSSPALRAVAAAYGLEHAETLSGFKWVSRVPNLIFGFEEALGYLTHPGVIRDKDGISAAADALLMVSELHADGKTIWNHLDEASERFGHFASTQVVVRLDSPAAVAELAEKVRVSPPTEFDGIAVTHVRDLMTPGAAEVPANVLAYTLSDGSRVMIRPSGTEPKLKAYLDAFSDQGTARERKHTATQALTRIEHALREYLAATAAR